ncbi:MAG TPA: hypothetical protein VGQ09_16155 [Chitinophagaceae bacterium]|jgi:hypothetical protein|nr:hypothetical protein [Chitinophagaceae bacterium]
MTPELKTACELIFQEHKLSAQPIKWNRDAFRGRISIGLSEIAKETLVKKNIILLPAPSKKLFTQLNPDVASADSFEEAEKIIETKIPNLEITPAYDAEVYITNHVFGFAATPPQEPIARTSKIKVTDKKWYMKPFYLYVTWPLCGGAAGVLISRLMDLAYTELFLNPK